MPKAKKPIQKVNKVKQSRKIDLLHSPIIIFAILFFIILGSYFGYQKYLDWQNKRLIQGISQDFPTLIAGVENVIGQNLDIASDCMVTREKYSEGVALCGLTSGLTENISEEIDLNKMITYFESTEQNTFIKGEIFANKNGYKYFYKGRDMCTFRYKYQVYIDCAFGVRDANKELASELLSEETLNARKKELLNQ